MIPQNGEEGETKPFNPTRACISAEALCSPWASAMGWVAPFLAPACVNITEIREKGEKHRVENVFKSEWIALAQ